MTAGWLGAALVVFTISGDPGLGALMVFAIVATTMLATEDQIGAAGLSGLFATLAVLLLGWPAGSLVALGSIALGDGVLRRVPARSLVWHAALLTAMLTAGAWVAGAPQTAAPPAAAGRAVGVVWCAIYVVFAVVKARHGSPPTAAAQGGGMILVMTAALTATAWLPLLPATAERGVAAGLHGMGFAAAFMLVDFAASSLAARRTAGPGALDFWLDHLPVLFVRYASQGLAAGLIVYWYDDAGVFALAAATGGMLLLQAVYFFYRRADETVESAIAALASAIDARDPYTAGHSIRVAEYAALAAVRLGWSKAKVARTNKAGLLHDVGKLGVADDVLHKPGPLSEVEFAHMKRHAAVGEDIVAQVRGLSDVATIVGQDHERWAGGGYPRGLSGQEILPEARLIAIADVFDAMTTDRPYRAALTEEDALAHLESVAGSQLDPALTASFINVVRAPRPSGVAFCYCATH
ncbi:MAG: HD-GYP domain-containing protein [Chloroflexi bacterium]|nr:HD-GYP domain-containing protein [Chloroflexota bacterium]